MQGAASCVAVSDDGQEASKSCHEVWYIGSQLGPNIFSYEFLRRFVSPFAWIDLSQKVSKLQTLQKNVQTVTLALSLVVPSI